MAEAVSRLRPPRDHAVEFDPDTPTAPVRDHAGQQLRCSFCQVGLGEGIGLTTHGFEKQRHRTTSSSFCSTRCRDCVLALAELHPSPLATDDFIARRALLHRSAPRSLATRSGARPGARAGGCPNRQQRPRERRHRLTTAQPSTTEEHGDIARAVSPACRRAPRRSSVQRPASSVPYRPSPLPAVVLRAMRIHLLDTRVSRHACCTRTPRALSNTLVTLDHAGVSMRHVRVTGPVRIRRAVRGRRHQRDIQV